MTRCELAGLTITVEILQGRDLVAKDRNLVGMRSTSDPYVKLHIDGKLIGKTRVISKTLNPVWNSHFQYLIGADSATRVIRRTHARLVATVTIWDHDKVGNDDSMGTILITLDPLLGGSTQWYPVGNGTGDTFCRNAKGQIQVKITYEGSKMMHVSRGQAHTLLYNRVRVGLASGC
jgi:hypothetical protein